jgi:N-acetylneuraminate synthase/N,N'-diacetyllegionaminate synthase
MTSAVGRFTVAGRTIAAGQPVFVIAEAGVNHNGDPAMAKALIDAAADGGADAVKFQTF